MPSSHFIKLLREFGVSDGYDQWACLDSLKLATLPTLAQKELEKAGMHRGSQAEAQLPVVSGDAAANQVSAGSLLPRGGELQVPFGFLGPLNVAGLFWEEGSKFRQGSTNVTPVGAAFLHNTEGLILFS